MPKLKPDRQRFMIGHTALDVHGKVYLEHPPAKLKPFIDKLPDPTVDLGDRSRLSESEDWREAASRLSGVDCSLSQSPPGLGK
jgi:hypothetical protein